MLRDFTTGVELLPSTGDKNDKNKSKCVRELK